MCGICGIVLKNIGNFPVDPEKAVRLMASHMHHRGPDDEGFGSWPAQGVYLAQRRLAIIDLSTAGRQPLFSEDRLIAALVNGEIYNYRELRAEMRLRGHRFASQSDCEVIPHLWEEIGAETWGRLRGMYAAAVYDSRDRMLTLARDPLGIKPLYVLEMPGAWAFASEINAFQDLPVQLDIEPAGMADYLLLGCVPAPLTHRRGVRALQAGQQLLLRDGVARWSSPFDIGALCRAAVDESSSPERVKDTVRDSIRRHMISDAPIGLFLSGGMDSGTIAGIATEVTGSDVRAITVGSPGHPTDETAQAQLTARHYGVKLQEIALTQADFEQDIDHFFQHLDLPSRDGFNTYVVSKAARLAGLTVALSGTGGDEMFAGYSTFRWVPFFGRVNNIAHLFGRQSARLAALLLRFGTRSSGAKRVAELMRHRVADRRVAYLAYRGLFVGGILEDILVPEWRPQAEAALERYLAGSAWCLDPDIPDAIAVAGLEWQYYWGPMLLRDADALSMAHSLEVRLPLTDIEVFKAALPLLAHPPAGDGRPKWALRNSLDRPLPEAVVQGKKRGFVFPWQEWVRGVTLKDFDVRAGGAGKAGLKVEGLIRWREQYLSGSAYWQNFWALYVAMRMTSD